MGWKCSCHSIEHCTFCNSLFYIFNCWLADQCWAGTWVKECLEKYVVIFLVLFLALCRRSVVIYKATCTRTGKSYIGNTQQKVKKRIKGHLGDVWNLANKNRQSDSFVWHFVTVAKAENRDKLTRKDVRKCISVEILWQGNPITVMKMFGKLSCRLCMKEKIHILNEVCTKPKSTINRRNKLYGACRHKTRFHRYTSYTISADEELFSPKRVSQHTTTPVPISPREEDSPLLYVENV